MSEIVRLIWFVWPSTQEKNDEVSWTLRKDVFFKIKIFTQTFRTKLMDDLEKNCKKEAVQKKHECICKAILYNMHSLEFLHLLYNMNYIRKSNIINP